MAGVSAQVISHPSGGSSGFVMWQPQGSERQGWGWQAFGALRVRPTASRVTSQLQDQPRVRSWGSPLSTLMEGVGDSYSKETRDTCKRMDGAAATISAQPPARLTVHRRVVGALPQWSRRQKMGLEPWG